MPIDLFVIGCLLFLTELVYIRIAAHFKILDHPNQRSSHSVTTITGGGIIFIIAMGCYPIFFDFNYNFFLIGLLLVGSVSFLDDLRPLNYKIRILAHFIAVSLLFYQLDIFDMPAHLIVIVFIIAIGIINAVNFMDGINGMTGGYVLVTLASLLYINNYVVEGFVDNMLIITAMLGVSVFIFFNFRTKAKCFAGDVGSIGKAFLLIFLIGKLVLVSGNPAYILLLFVYGLDTVSTIFFRICRRENIIEAHRSHYFQYLVHDKKIPQLYVSSGYALIQLLFNVLLLFGLLQSWLLLIAFIILLTYIFIMIRFSMEGKQKLLFP